MALTNAYFIKQATSETIASKKETISPKLGAVPLDIKKNATPKIDIEIPKSDNFIPPSLTWYRVTFLQLACLVIEV